MAKNVVTVPSTATIREVGKIIAENEFYTLHVVDEGQLVRIATSIALINYLVKKL